MKPSINDYSLGDFENVDEYRNWKFEAIAKLELQFQQAQVELAGMILMEAEGETFGETIVRENEQLKEEITTWEAKAALFVDQGEELQQEKFRHCVTKKLLANEQAMLNKRYEQMEQLKTERDALVDTLEHCGYDPEDCIDCGGPPHNKWCRFWKLRHILSYWEEEIERAQ